MHKYLPLLVTVMLVACGDGDTGGGQTGSSTSTVGAGGSSSSGSGAGGVGGAGGAGGGGGAGGMPITEVAGEASTVNSCAPDDGKAFTIKIGLPERTCQAKPAGPLLSISFYTNVDSPAGNSWNLSAGAGEAQGIYQPDGDPFNIIVVNIGNLTVATWSMSGATGTYDVILNDGTHLVGLFDAIGCLQDPVLCG